MLYHPYSRPRPPRQRLEFITRTRPRKRSRKQEKKKENNNSTKKATKKKRKKILFFLITFLDEFLYFFLFFLFSYFLVFFYKLPPLGSIIDRYQQLLYAYMSYRLAQYAWVRFYSFEKSNKITPKRNGLHSLIFSVFF